MVLRRRHGRWMKFALPLGACLVVATAIAGCGDDDEGNGGSAAAGGSSGSDTQAPEFTGLKSAEAVGETRVELKWDSASDNVTKAARIAYHVYASTTPGEQNFSTPVMTAPAGATGALLADLRPSSTYHFVVRAVDEAGNSDSNAVEKSALTPDATPPRFAGAIKVAANTSRSLLVEWKPANDRGTPPDGMRYRAYVSKVLGGQDFTTPSAVSDPGQSSVVVPGLDPLTTYYVVARALDEAGLEDTNEVELTATTPEGDPPSFLGVKYAITNGNSVRLYWFPATDVGNEPANIVYDIYDAPLAGGQNYSQPSYSSEPGAASHLIEGLEPGSRHWFVVRARDPYFNRDLNTVEQHVRVEGVADTVAPNFEGVKSVTGASSTSLVVQWDEAEDNETHPSRMLYHLYVSDVAGGQNFSTPTLVSAPGATSATLTGLAPLATRFVVVRAVDEAGNSVPLTTELSGQTPARTGSDTTPPTFGTGPTIAIQPEAKNTQLMVSWGAATDDTFPAADIRYHLCAETLETNCLGTAFTRHIRATSEWGATSVVLTQLLSRTAYAVYVRAEDRNGNFETGNHSGNITTATSFSRNILPILHDKCNGCHEYRVIQSMVDVEGGFIDPDLAVAGENQTLCRPSPDGDGGVVEGKGCLKLVEPGRPDRSLIYRRINPKGLQAPPFSAEVDNDYSGIQEPRDGAGLGYTPLSNAEDGAIRDWIVEGGHGD